MSLLHTLKKRFYFILNVYFHFKHTIMVLSARHYVCRCVLRAVVQCDDKLTISASWSKDEDISRLLQSLPNWTNLTQPRQKRQKREDEDDFTRYAFMCNIPMQFEDFV